jgi:hypothetical protein
MVRSGENLTILGKGLHLRTRARGAAAGGGLGRRSSFRGNNVGRRTPHLRRRRAGGEGEGGDGGGGKSVGRSSALEMCWTFFSRERRAGAVRRSPGAPNGTAAGRASDTRHWARGSRHRAENTAQRPAVYGDTVIRCTVISRPIASTRHLASFGVTRRSRRRPGAARVRRAPARVPRAAREPRTPAPPGREAAASEGRGTIAEEIYL